MPPPAQARAAHPHDAPSTPTHSGPGARTPLSPLAQPVFSPQGGGGDDVRMSGADDNICPPRHRGAEGRGTSMPPPPPPALARTARPAAANPSPARGPPDRGRADCVIMHDRNAPSTPTHSGPGAGAGARTPFSPISQPVFSPRGGGGGDVRMSGADDDDIENRQPNRDDDAASRASIGSGASSARRASNPASSRPSDQTISSLANSVGSAGQLAERRQGGAAGAQ